MLDNIFENFYDCPVCGAKLLYTGDEELDAEAIWTHIANHSIADLLSFVQWCVAESLQKNAKIKSRLRRQ